MNNIIDFNQERLQLKQDAMAAAYYELFTTVFDAYLHYFVYPLVAAVLSAHSKRIVKVSHY